MDPIAIYISILSAIVALGSLVSGNETWCTLALYVLLSAILIEIGCIHEILKEK